MTSIVEDVFTSVLQEVWFNTDMHTFPYTISWENWIKDQGIFPVVIILIIPITFPLNYVLKMLRGN